MVTCEQFIVYKKTQKMCYKFCAFVVCRKNCNGVDGLNQRTQTPVNLTMLFESSRRAVKTDQSSQTGKVSQT